MVLSFALQVKLEGDVPAGDAPAPRAPRRKRPDAADLEPPPLPEPTNGALASLRSVYDALDSIELGDDAPLLKQVSAAEGEADISQLLTCLRRATPPQLARIAQSEGCLKVLAAWLQVSVLSCSVSVLASRMCRPVCAGPAHAALPQQNKAQCCA